MEKKSLTPYNVRLISLSTALDMKDIFCLKVIPFLLIAKDKWWSWNSSVV